MQRCSNSKRWWKLSVWISLLLVAVPTPSCCQQNPSPFVRIQVDQARRDLGEAKLNELKGQAEHSPCWKEVVKELNSSCKLLSDVKQSKLAVAFANCHLEKSGRKTYPCSDDTSIENCTRDMDHNAFHTYTHFYTHTGHICYFLQIEQWQDRTEKLVGQLSDASSKALDKLEQSLQYHHIMNEKQSSTLKNQDIIIDQDRKIASSLRDTHRSMETSFSDMLKKTEMYEELLEEMFGRLNASIGAIQYIMSLMLIEIIGYETVFMFVITWFVVLLLPHFRYSRLKLCLLLIVEVVLEVFVRQAYGYMALGQEKIPENLAALHKVLWWCRYGYVAISIPLYIREWYKFLDYAEENHKTLEELKRALSRLKNRKYMGPEKKKRRYPVKMKRILNYPTTSASEMQL